MKVCAIHVTALWDSLLGHPGTRCRGCMHPHKGGPCKDGGSLDAPPCACAAFLAPNADDEAARAGARAAANLPAIVAAVSQGFDRVLLILDGEGGWRGELDAAHREARAKWPRAAWAPLEGALPRPGGQPIDGGPSYVVMVPPPYPDRALGSPMLHCVDLGNDESGDGRDALDLAGRRPAARDVIATIAAWWQSSDASPRRREGRGRLRIVTNRTSLLGLADRAAGIEVVRDVVWEANGWQPTAPVTDAETDRSLGYDPRLAVDLKAIESLRGFGPKSLTARALICGGQLAAGTSREVSVRGRRSALTLVQEVAALAPDGKLSGVTAPQLASLRAAAAHGGAGILRALALVATRADVPIDVGALLRLDGGEDGAGQSRGGADDSDRSGGYGRRAVDLDPRSEPRALDDAGPGDGGEHQGRAVVLGRNARDAAPPARPLDASAGAAAPAHVEPVAAPSRPTPAAPSLPRCPRAGCHIDDGETCAAGHMTREQCDETSARLVAAFDGSHARAVTPINDRDTTNATGATTMTDTQQTAEPTYSHETGEERARAAAESTTPPVVETPAEAASRAAEWSRPAPTSAPLPVGASSLGIDPSSAEWAMTLQPRDASEAYRMAKAFHASQLYAKKFKSVEAIWTVMLLGREHGLSALASLQSLTIIEGKVEMDAALIVAKILRSGAARHFRLVESDNDHATWATHRVGPEEKPISMSFSVADARKRGLVRGGSNWEKMPDVMCMWRAATKLGRAIYPDVLRGLYGQGEIRETTLADAGLDAVAEQALATRGTNGAQPQRRAS